MGAITITSSKRLNQLTTESTATDSDILALWDYETSAQKSITAAVFQKNGKGYADLSAMQAATGLAAGTCAWVLGERDWFQLEASAPDSDLTNHGVHYSSSVGASYRWVRNYSVLTKSVTVSSADILQLNSSPKSLLVTPGSNRAIDVLLVSAFLDYNSAGYAGSENVDITYSGGSSVVGSIPYATLNSTSDVYYVCAKSSSAVLTNAAITASTTSADPTTGNSPLYLKIVYRIIDWN